MSNYPGSMTENDIPGWNGNPAADYASDNFNDYLEDYLTDYICDRPEEAAALIAKLYLNDALKHEQFKDGFDYVWARLESDYGDE